MELSIWRPFYLMPFVERNCCQVRRELPLLIVGWRKCHWWNFANAGDRHPELLDLEGFINHA